MFREVDITIDPEDVLDQLDVEDIVNHFDVNEVLDCIDTKAVYMHYDPDELLDCFDREELLDYLGIEDDESK